MQPCRARLWAPRLTSMTRHRPYRPDRLKNQERRMSMIVWILLGLGLGLVASKIVSTTGEGTVVDILLGIVGAAAGGGLFSIVGGIGVTGFDLNSLYSAGAAVIGAIILLAIYHAFFRR